MKIECRFNSNMKRNKIKITNIYQEDNVIIMEIEDKNTFHNRRVILDDHTDNRRLLRSWESMKRREIQYEKMSGTNEKSI